ncbi:MAG TPA: PfkB family carbohydrate kinase [Casimicrobiaceae bacterium]|nr:PfkB family carbohydrate kinase [Casimicrobiaceae bacterium]
MTRLLCIGHSALDAIYRVPAIPTFPTKVLASRYVETGGGMAANASFAAKRLGADVEYWGRVGDDALGDRILSELAAAGIGTATVRRVPGCKSPTAAILVADDGERLICIYNDPALDSDASWLPLAAAVLDSARAARVPTVLDADVGPAEALRELCARCDYAIFSTAGLKLASASADPGEGLRNMQRLAGGIVAVTLGEEGALWLEAGRERRETAPRVAAIDTLAAGDVFHGAFALAIGEGRGVAAAARFANAAAALKCTRFGGRLGAPTRAEVEAFLSAGA